MSLWTSRQNSWLTPSGNRANDCWLWHICLMGLTKGSALEEKVLCNLLCEIPMVTINISAKPGHYCAIYWTGGFTWSATQYTHMYRAPYVLISASQIRCLSPFNEQKLFADRDVLQRGITCEQLWRFALAVYVTQSSLCKPPKWCAQLILRKAVHWLCQHKEGMTRLGWPSPGHCGVVSLSGRPFKLWQATWYTWHLAKLPASVLSPVPCLSGYTHQGALLCLHGLTKPINHLKLLSFPSCPTAEISHLQYLSATFGPSLHSGRYLVYPITSISLTYSFSQDLLPHWWNQNSGYLRLRWLSACVPICHQIS